MEGLAAKKKAPQIARDLLGPERMAEQGWESDGDLRARVRRLVKKARALMQGDYLELAAGRRPRL